MQLIARTSKLLFATALLFAVTACESDPVPATSLLVTVDSDLQIGSEITAVQVEIRNPQGARTSKRHTFELAEDPRGDQTDFDFSFGVEKTSDERIQLVFVGLNGDEEVVEYRVNARFQDEKTLGLSVFLASACVRKECMRDTTCYGRALDGVAAGECGEIRGDALNPVDPGEDPPDAGSEPEAGSGGRAGSAGGAGRGGSAGTAGRGGAGAGGAGSGGAGSGGAGASGAGGAGTGGAGSGGAGSGGSPAGCAACLQGETCVAGQCVCALTRTTYYRDGDLDGYGDPDMERVFCGTPPAGWVSTDTDCCDADSDAFPGQQLGGQLPSNCPENGFDYNCDGLEEQAYPVNGSGQCCTATEQPGWYGTEVPECGETAVFNACDDSCTPVAYDEIQHCR